MELSKALEQATERPWRTGHTVHMIYGSTITIEADNAGATVADVYMGETDEADAALICHAVNMLPELVEVLSDCLITLDEAGECLCAKRGHTILARAKEVEGI